MTNSLVSLLKQILQTFFELKKVLDYTMLEFHSYVGSIEYMVRLKERSQPTKSFKTLYEILLNMSN